MNYNGKIALKAVNGQYCCAEGSGGQAVIVNRTVAGPWETFQLYDRGNGQVALQVSSNQYVCAEGGGGQALVANRNVAGAWETFKVIDRGNGQIALQSANGQYVCAEGGGGQPLAANRSTIGPWETFTLVDMTPGVVAYSDSNYSGVFQQLGQGNYDINSLSVGNDMISSLKVPSGVKVTLFEHGGFAGRSKVFTEDTWYVGDDFNDITSSLKVESLSVPPIVKAAEVAAIRQNGEKLAVAGKPISEGYKTNPPDSLTPVPIKDLVSSGQLFQYNLSKRLGIQNNKLTLSKDLLAEFGEVGEIVSGILNLYVSIENPVITYVEITPGKSGIAGKPYSNDITTDTTPATVQTTALQISGDTVLLSTINVRLQYAEFAQLKAKPYGVFKFIITEPIGLGSIFKGVPVLEGINISEPTLVLSSTPYLYDPSLDYGISMGFNFFGKFQIGTSKDKTFNYIGNLLGVPEVLLHGVVDMYGANKAYRVEATVPADKYIINGKNFKVKFSKTTLGLSVMGEPLEPAVYLANEMIVTLIWGNETTNLVFTGGLKVETESITGSFTMQAKNDQPYSSLSGNVVAAGEWKNPFGIPGISIREMAVQIGGTYEEPWIDNIGVHGNLKIGDWDGSMSVLVDINDPDQFVLAGATDHITILQIMSAVAWETLIAYQALPGTIKDQLDKFINLSLEDVKLSIVPSATKIGTIEFIEEGIRFNGKLNAWGWHANAFVYINPSKGVEVSAAMDNINLLNVFKISGAQNDPNPMLHVKFIKLSAPDLVISSYIYLLGISQETQVKASPSGFTFYFERNFESICTAKLNCAFSDFNLTAQGSIYFKLNINITTVFGNIKLVDVALNVNTSLKVGTKYGFQATMSGTFQFYGHSFTMPTLNVQVTPRDFRDLYDAVVKQITNNAEALFKTVFTTLAEWANAVKNGAIQYAGQVANVAKNVYHATEKEVINAYKTLNKGANEIAAGLKDVYGYSSQGIATALKGAGFAINEVGNALKSVYGLSAQATTAALKGAGYAINEVGNAVKGIYNLSAEGMATALKGAGYALNETGFFVKKSYNLGADGLNKALSAAGYAGDKIKDFFGTLGGDFIEVFDDLDPTNW